MERTYDPPSSTTLVAQLCHQHLNGRRLSPEQVDQLVESASKMCAQLDRSRQALERAAAVWGPLRDELNMLHTALFARTSDPFDNHLPRKRDQRPW